MENANAIFEKAQTLLKEKDYLASISLYFTVTELAPHHYRAYHFRGDALRYLGRTDEAIAMYQQAISVNPNSYWSYHNLSVISHKQGDLEQAIHLSKKSIEALEAEEEEASSDIWILRNRLIQYLVESENVDEVIAIASLEASASDFTLQTCESLIKAYVVRDMLPAALQLYYENEAIATSVALELAEALLSAKQVETAEGVLKSTLEKTDNKAWIYHRLAYCYIVQNRVEAAAVSYLKALIDDLTLNPAFSQLCSLYKQNKSLQLPEEYLLTLLEKCRSLTAEQPQNKILHIRAGDIYSLLGYTEEANSFYRRATYLENLKFNPNYVEAHWSNEPSKGPNFIIIGTMKGGTTSLYEYISSHPQSLCASQKELHFFTLSNSNSTEQYLSHFPAIPLDLNFVVGEASPSYLDWTGNYPDIPSIVKKTCPNTKIISILRDPVDRAISCYHHQVRMGLESRSLKEVIRMETEGESISSSGIITSGLYWRNLKKWIDQFGLENMLILNSQSLYEFPIQTMKKVYQFLGISLDYADEQAFRKANAGSYSDCETDIKSHLSNFFLAANADLQHHLNIKFTS